MVLENLTERVEQWHYLFIVKELQERRTLKGRNCQSMDINLLAGQLEKNGMKYLQMSRVDFQQKLKIALTQIKMQQRTSYTESPVYPTVNLYSSSRVSGQRVNNAKIPLLKYRDRITINNASDRHYGNFVESRYLRKIQAKDGLINSFKKMSKDRFAIGSIKVLICVCMYNQSKNAINLTLNGIYKNLPHMRENGISDGDIAVVLIQDGILKLVQDRVTRTLAKGNNSMVKFFQMLDKNQGKQKCDLAQRINVILDQIDSFGRANNLSDVSRNRDFPPSLEKNIALVYQNLWKPSKTYFPESGPKPKDFTESLRLFSCFKHTNGTKLSSHLWFFEGFCRYLKPKYCVLLDVGTTPDKTGLMNLIKGFSASHNIGGCTGFMSVDSNFKSEEGGDEEEESGNCLTRLCCSIERAQEYEYIIAHFVDKNCESALGFLHVLPGAWSAYRYEALIKSEKYEPNLLERSYFKMILNPEIEEKDFREANMYLAEDRILSLGIYCQMDSKYLLKYVPDAIAYTDPMKDHENLMNQRRRWINSSLFAFMYVFKNYYFSVMDSKHNFFRKYVTLNISMFLALLSLFNSYITPSIFFFTLYSGVYQIGFRGSDWVAKACVLIYTFIFFTAVGGALTGRQWSKHAGIISTFLSVFTFLLILLVFYTILFVYINVFNIEAFNTLIDSTGVQVFDPSSAKPKQWLALILVAANIGCFILILFAHIFTHPKFVCKILVNTMSYLFYIGAYSQTMVIHGFCNVDDVSWGTKGSSAGGVKKYESDKVYFVSTWLFYNAILLFIFIYIDILSLQNQLNMGGGVVLLGIGIYGTAFLVIKSIFALYYHFKWLITEKCCLQLTDKGERDRSAKIQKFWLQQRHEWMKNFQGQSDLSFFFKKKK